MIAMMIGKLRSDRNVTYWAPISGSNSFPASYSKDLYRLDDGNGSGDVLIETSAKLYSGVKLLAYEYPNSWALENYSYLWPKGVNRVLTGSTEPVDFIPTNPNLPQVTNRCGFIVFPITIPANHWFAGKPSITADFTCYARITAYKWWESDGYCPRFGVTLIGDVPDNGKYHLLRVDLDLPDKQFGNDVPLDTVWSTVTSIDFLTQRVLEVSGRNASFGAYYTADPNGKAVHNLDSYLIDFSAAKCTTISPDKGEYSFWFGRSTGIINNPDGIDPRQFSRAFYAAQEKLPEASQNQIANICDIVSAIRGFAKKPYLVVEKGSNALKNAWLAYRYSYSTTKSDILELADLSARLSSLGTVVKSFGSTSTSSASYYAEIVVDASYYMPAECSSLLRKLQQYGVKINLQNAWDMIPYSFVADWFLDVSSLLASFDQWIATSSIPIKEVWYSCVTNYDDGRAAYFRWQGDPPSLPSWSYHISKNGNTWLKRMADVISLL